MSAIGDWAALWSRLILAAGGETIPIEAGVAAVDRARPLLAEAQRLFFDAGAPGFDPDLPARWLHERGAGAAICELMNAGELLRERLEDEGYEPERWSPLEVRDGSRLARPDGLHLVPAGSERDLFAWEQIESEFGAETDEPAGRAAALSSWLRASGASLWLATLSGTPAGAAALFVQGNEALAARLTERPALRRRGVEQGMLALLFDETVSRGAAALRCALPAPDRAEAGLSGAPAIPWTAFSLPGEGEAGTILRFLVQAEED